MLCKTLLCGIIYILGDDHHLFDIDAKNGAIIQIQSVRQAGLPDKEFRLVIQVW